MEGVVGPEGWQRPGPDAVCEEYLGGAVNPGGSPQQEVPVRSHVVDQAVHRTLQCEGPAQQDRQHHVRGECREPDDLQEETSNPLYQDPVQSSPCHSGGDLSRQ